MDFPDDFESFGLYRDDIQRDVELKLRLAGITIDEKEEKYLLYVNVGGLCVSSGTCGYSVKMYFTELVFVPRGDEYIEVVDAATWMPRGYTGIVGSNKLPSVRDDVKDMVDKFINAFLTANPKQ